jgi:hypothetical protein
LTGNKISSNEFLKPPNLEAVGNLALGFLAKDLGEAARREEARPEGSAEGSPEAARPEESPPEGSPVNVSVFYPHPNPDCFRLFFADAYERICQDFAAQREKASDLR